MKTKKSSWRATDTPGLHVPYLYRIPQLWMLYWHLSKILFCFTASPTSARDNGLELVTKIFNTSCGFIGVEQLMTTVYHLHMNVPTEQYNNIIFAQLLQNGNENQLDWDLFVQSLAYTYWRQINRLTRMTPFRLLVTCEPPGPTLQDLATALLHHGSHPIPAELLYIYTKRTVGHSYKNW